jgi:CRISPR-associated protein (TIGR03986 family)
MKAINAPYNFVPLANWVHIPDWSLRASHDVPFRDGLSGELHLELTADSPLLVGGRQTPASKEHPGEVHPYRLPHGRYAIPGSSLKGMLRSVVEIAGFGRMRMLDEVRPALRDISGNYVEYRERIGGKVKAGMLRRASDGGAVLIPCSMSSLYHDRLEHALPKGKKPLFKKTQSVKDKYDAFNKRCHSNGLSPDNLRFDREDDPKKRDQTLAFLNTAGNLTGKVVLTGQVGKKKRDFLFHTPREDEQRPVTTDEWADFLAIHSPENPADGMPWPEYWEGRYDRSEDVPVFYIEEDGRLRLGLAFMPKLAADYSTHDMVRHADERHGEVPGRKNGYDLADLLFGSVGEEPADSLKGRVSFETFTAKDNPEPQAQGETILNSPKPSYFPNYVVQRTVSSTACLEPDQENRQTYQTYLKPTKARPSQELPRIRGFKRYPARAETTLQRPTGEQKNNVQVRLHTLPGGTRFTGRVVFHNLRPVELGALLWAITWGKRNDYRHALGMGKSFGFGQIRLTLQQGLGEIHPNDPKAHAQPIDDERVTTLVRTFEAHMEGSVPGSWELSPQLVNLLAMAAPEAARKLPDEFLRHMRLDPSLPKGDQFVEAKKYGLVLGDYAAMTEWSQVLSEARKARQEAELQAEEERRALEEAAKLEEARKKTAHLPEDAQELELLWTEHGEVDNSAFLELVETYLEDRASLSPEAWKQLAEGLNARWGKIMDDPDATRGKPKKLKFKFKERPRNLAKRVIGLRP